MANSPEIWFGKNRQWLTAILPPAFENLREAMVIAAERGSKTVAFLYEDSPFPRGAIRPLIPFVEELGLKLVLDEAYPPGTLDLEPILFKAKSLGAASSGYRIL